MSLRSWTGFLFCALMSLAKPALMAALQRKARQTVRSFSWVSWGSWDSPGVASRSLTLSTSFFWHAGHRSQLKSHSFCYFFRFSRAKTGRLQVSLRQAFFGHSPKKKLKLKKSKIKNFLPKTQNSGKFSRHLRRFSTKYNNFGIKSGKNCSKTQEFTQNSR